MRSFVTAFGTTVESTIVISAAVPKLTFTDTTTGDDDWSIHADGDDLVFTRESTVEMTWDSSDDELDINGGLNVLAGDLTVSRANSGLLLTQTLQNTSTVTSSKVLLTVLSSATSGGSATGRLQVADGAGDPVLNFRIASGGNFVLGIDNSEADAFCINTGTSLSTSAASLVIDSSDNVSIPNGDLTIKRSQTGSVIAEIANSVGSGANDAQFRLRVGSASGNPIILYGISTASFAWVHGISNADGDAWALVNSTGAFSTDNAGACIVCDTSENVKLPGGDLTVSRAATAGLIISTVQNDSLTAGSGAFFRVVSSAPDANSQSTIVSRTTKQLGTCGVGAQRTGATANDAAVYLSIPSNEAIGAIGTSVAPAAGARWMEFGSSFGVTIPNGSLTVEGGNIKAEQTLAGVLLVNVTNDSTSGSAYAGMSMIVGGPDSGDPYQQFTITGANSWVTGIDNDSGDAYCINTGTALSAAGAALSIDTSDNVTIPNGDLTVSRNVSGNVQVILTNTSSSTQSKAILNVTSGAVNGDSELRFSGNTQDYTIGNDGGLDSFIIRANSGLNGTQSDNAIIIDASANVSIPNGYLSLSNQADPGAVTNGVRLGSIDSASASKSVLALRTEDPVVAGKASAVATQQLTIIINGASYNMFVEPR